MDEENLTKPDIDQLASEGKISLANYVLLSDSDAADAFKEYCESAGIPLDDIAASRFIELTESLL